MAFCLGLDCILARQTSAAVYSRFARAKCIVFYFVNHTLIEISYGFVLYPLELFSMSSLSLDFLQLGPEARARAGFFKICWRDRSWSVLVECLGARGSACYGRRELAVPARWLHFVCRREKSDTAKSLHQQRTSNQHTTARSKKRTLVSCYAWSVLCGGSFNESRLERSAAEQICASMSR